MRNLLIITWVSASGKTTLQEELLSRWWSWPINFTTRAPRNEGELDEYVFLNKEQFFFKLNKWDFLEHTNYNWNWYGVSKWLPEWDICVVLDPVWREQVLEKIVREDIQVRVTCIYLRIDEKLQMKRLLERWDTSEQIELRSTDFDWFQPNEGSYTLDWWEDFIKNANYIECEILKKTIHSE